jgi:ribosome-binding factor A
MSIRTARVASLIKQQISETLAREVDSTGYGLLTVTEVSITPDLRLARVHVSHFKSGKTDEEVLTFLDEHSREIRMAVGKSVRLKFTPELRFFIDQSLDRVERIEELLKQIHEDEQKR